MKLIFTESYEKIEKRFLSKHRDLAEKYKKVLILLEHNPYHPSLRLHKLKGKMRNLYSVSINLQYRLVFYFIIDKDTIILVHIGLHEEVYRQM